MKFSKLHYALCRNIFAISHRTTKSSCNRTQPQFALWKRMYKSDSGTLWSKEYYGKRIQIQQVNARIVFYINIRVHTFTRSLRKRCHSERVLGFFCYLTFKGKTPRPYNKWCYSYIYLYPSQYSAIFMSFCPCVTYTGQCHLMKLHALI